MGQRDKDMATLNLLDEKAVIIRKLTELFEAIDEDESGLITMDEIEQVLSEQFTHAYLESLGITTTDAWTLVKLLDHDKTGTIDLEEFIHGCMDLRGNAKAVHVA